MPANVARPRRRARAGLGLDHLRVVDERHRAPGLALLHDVGRPAGAGDGPRPDDLPVQRDPELDDDLPARAAVGSVGAPAAVSYWAVASWYVDGQGGVAFHSNLVSVNPGDVLVGRDDPDRASRAAGSATSASSRASRTRACRSATCEELTWNIETLEAYGVQQCSDYPDTNFTAFVTIDLQTSAGRPAITWTPVNAVTDCGQSARVVSNANPGGEVDIYYTTARRRIGASTASINSDGRLETFLSPRMARFGTSGRRHPHAGPWSRINSLGGIVEPRCAGAQLRRATRDLWNRHRQRRVQQLANEPACRTMERLESSRRLGVAS